MHQTHIQSVSISSTLVCFCSQTDICHEICTLIRFMHTFHIQTHKYNLNIGSLYEKNTFPKPYSFCLANWSIYQDSPLGFGKVIQFALDFVFGQITFPQPSGRILYKYIVLNFHSQQYQIQEIYFLKMLK